MLTIIGVVAFLPGPGIGADEEDWVDKGLKLISQKKYDEAIEAFSAAIEIIPRDYQAYNYRGVARALKGDFDKAVADYSKALKIRPRYAAAFNNRGFAHTQRGELQQALNDYSRALEINPFFVDAYNNKAWILATAADSRYRNGAKAIMLAQKAVELKSNVASLDTLAAAYAAVGNFESAIDTQKKAVQKLLVADQTSEVPKYMRHLNVYRSRQSLRINYSAARKHAKTDDLKVSLKAKTKDKPSLAPKEEKIVTLSESTTTRTTGGLDFTAAGGKRQGREVPQSLRVEPGAKHPVWKTQSKKAGTENLKFSLKAKTKDKPSLAPKEEKIVTPSESTTTRKAGGLDFTAAGGKRQGREVPQSLRVEPGAKHPVWKTQSKKTVSLPSKSLPYTIQVSAFRDLQKSNQVVRKLLTKGDRAFTCPVQISGKGKWHRVYIGYYNTREEAKVAAAGLKKRSFRYVRIAKKPYAVQVGLVGSEKEAQELKSRLQAKGYLAYSLPAGTEQSLTRILIGAYESKEAAAILTNQLQNDGFNAKILPR
jgi:cell division septation protein DedD